MKRGRLEIIRDILGIIEKNHGEINITPLLRKTNISSKNFYEYLREIKEKGFIEEIKRNDKKKIKLKDKGRKYLEKYQTIVNFINEFEL